MIIVMEPDAQESAIEAVILHLSRARFDVLRSSGQSRTILGVVGEVTADDVAVVRDLDGVSEVVRVSDPYRLASRRFRSEDTVVAGEFGRIGGGGVWIALEPVGMPPDGEAPSSAYALMSGGPFDAAVSRMERARDAVGALACMSIHPRPESPRWPVVFVTREPSWGATQWICAAERELARGGVSPVLLEAGGEYSTGRRSLDALSLTRTKARSHLPLVVDVAVIAQRARYCEAVALAAVAAGADGVILRVWVGDGSVATRPATLLWESAVQLAERLRAVNKVKRG